ncbi:MAG TPA: glycoside hydrolase family 5 protein [Bacteroidales bacterium]|nr:glycoside hydrolase family 5 protein [Bacteroidales bacterium]
MKKSMLLIALCIAGLSISLFSQAQVVAAKEQNLKIGKGVNVLGYDRAFWKDYTHGRFKEPYFKMIKEAGFSSVRVNLFPFSFMDKQTNTLDPHWLETLDWVVNKCLEAHLVVILDLHEFTAMADDPMAKKEMFLSFWKQVAPRYKDKPSDVIFEILNEPNQKLTVDMWNSFLVEAMNIIRETNPNRTLIIGPANWNGIESLNTLKLPEKDRNIIVTVHFYHPMRFTHQGAAWATEFKNLSGITWTGTPDEKKEVESKLQVAADWSVKNNRPIYLGEFGSYDKADMESRARYTAFVARTAEKLNFSWAYWQFDSDFIVYDVTKEAWVNPILNALIKKQPYN